MIRLRAATITVSNLTRSIELYTAFLDYKTVEDGTIDARLATSWDAPECAGQRYAVLQPASGTDIFLRLVEQPSFVGFRALRTYGWNAIEICVTDVMTVFERLKDSPFEIIGPPRENPGLANILPMQIKGPDQEVVFLTQINADTPPYKLPRARSLVDQIFILVIGCRDMNAASHWFAENIGLDKGEEMQIAYTMLSKAYGRDLGTQFALTTMTHANDVFLEIDQYPDEAAQRPRHPGLLPPGCAMATFWHPDIDRLPDLWITKPHVHKGPVYKGNRAGTLLGPDGALIEIVEN